VKAFVTVLVALLVTSLNAQDVWKSAEFTIARIKYRGGGDWYNDRSSIPNMLAYLKKTTSLNVSTKEQHVELSDDALFSYPFVFITGHGKIEFSDQEAARLRTYLTSGGFLFADDDYGMDKYFRAAMKVVFPEKRWVALPFNSKLFHLVHTFPEGVPKIHEHDGGPGKAFGLFHQGRLVAFYTFNTNITDGWADQKVHNNPEKTRQAAFRMGANIIFYALTR